VWQVPGQFPTIQAAIDSSSVQPGDVINVAPGRRAGATVTKAVTIQGSNGTTIGTGPVVNAFGRAGFLFPGGGQGTGATITGMTFVGVPFAVFSRGADFVTVSNNKVMGTVQGITNWANGTWGKAWTISGNTITGLRTSCGGGIGILIGDYAGGTVADNLITGNTVKAAVRVLPTDCGNYNAPGIALFADFRFPGDLGATVAYNTVRDNTVHITSTQVTLVTVSGVELSDTRDLTGVIVVSSNAIVYNDLRGMDVPVSLTPADLADFNRIEGNLTGPVPDAGPVPNARAVPDARALWLPSAGAAPIR
jgi:hypothetical protein